MMAAHEQARLRTTLEKDFGRVMSVIASVDATHARATNPEDRDMIFGLIDARAGGLPQFNADLSAALRRWLLGAARAQLAARAAARGGGDLGVNRLRDCVATLLQELGRYAEADAWGRG